MKQAPEYDHTRLVTIMSDRGMSQVDMARETGLSQPTIHDLYHGVTKMPKSATLLQIAAALGVHYTELLKKPAGRIDEGELRDQLLAAWDRLDTDKKRSMVAACRAMLQGPQKPPRR